MCRSYIADTLSSSALGVCNRPESVTAGSSKNKWPEYQGSQEKQVARVKLRAFKCYEYPSSHARASLCERLCKPLWSG